MLPFWPNYRFSHPDNYSFSLSTKIFSRSKYPKIKLFNFEKGGTALEVTITGPAGREAENAPLEAAQGNAARRHHSAEDCSLCHIPQMAEIRAAAPATSEFVFKIE